MALLVVGSLAFWLALVYPARLLWPDTPVAQYSAVAGALCLAPAAATLAWASWAQRRPPEQQLLMVLGGTVLRMAVVLGSGLTLYSLVPYFQRASFWVWLLIFYLFTLALEAALMVTGQSAPGDQQAHGSS